MPKHNFNVPVIDTEGDIVMKPIIDKTKMKINAQGQLIADTVMDADGYVKQEPVTMGYLMTQLLNHIAEGDDKDGELRKRKAKLARKVADKTEGSLKNYSVEELSLLTDLAAKFGSTEFIFQLDEMLNVDTKEEKTAA